MDEKTLLKYIKVKALSEDPATTPGERDVARKVLTRLEHQHDGIAQKAREYVRKKGPPRTTPPRRGPQAAHVGNWEYVFRYAQGLAQAVQEVVSDVSDALYGQYLAQKEVVASGSVRQKFFYVRVKMHASTVKEARSLNSVQREAFRRAVHEQIDEYLIPLIEGEE